MPNLCIVGHITKDILWHGDKAKGLPGGVPFYAGITAARLGLTVSVITKIAKRDQAQLSPPLTNQGIHLHILESATTTKFENHYDSGSGDGRRQFVKEIAEPFRSSDLSGIKADYFYLGPLTPNDMPISFLESVLRKHNVILDAQGFVRHIEESQVRPEIWTDKIKVLSRVSVLKVDQQEAQTLTRTEDPESAGKELASYGPQSVIVTLGVKGALIFEGETTYRIPAFRVRKFIDTTGCGDTFMAAFLSRRLYGEDVTTSGRFAAAVAALKIEQFGPFAGSINDVRNFLGQATVY
jgi:sugar/nucleoside kinase (ribokinase family)